MKKLLLFAVTAVLVTLASCKAEPATQEVTTTTTDSVVAPVADTTVAK